MSRGIAYGNKYKYYLLINEDKFTNYPIIADKDGNDIEDIENPIWNDFAWEDLKNYIVTSLKAHFLSSPLYVGRDACIFATSERLNIGSDTSGDTSCIFVGAEIYYRGNTECEYKIDASVKSLFNKLISEYSDYTFGIATSAWTSHWFKKGELYE